MNRAVRFICLSKSYAWQMTTMVNGNFFPYCYGFSIRQYDVILRFLTISHCLLFFLVDLQTNRGNIMCISGSQRQECFLLLLTSSDLEDCSKWSLVGFSSFVYFVGYEFYYVGLLCRLSILSWEYALERLQTLSHLFRILMHVLEPLWTTRLWRPHTYGSWTVDCFS